MVTCDATSFDHDQNRWQGGSLWMDGWMDGWMEGREKIKEIRKHPPEHGSKATAQRGGDVHISHTNFSVVIGEL